MHDDQQWTAVYVGSLAARMTMTGDGWKRRRSECSRKDTMAPSRVWDGDFVRRRSAVFGGIDRSSHCTAQTSI